jgi:CBS domain-containing protein
VLDAANVLSSLANQSDPIGALIDHAGSLPELVEASERITHMIRQLHGTGTKVGYITELSTELHRRVTERVFGMLRTRGPAERACLIVMGSEGRGEYMLKTDQDNGLVLDDGADPEAARGFARQLVDGLVAAGFPPCPGGIMANNPKWATTLRATGRGARVGGHAGRAGADRRRDLLRRRPGRRPGRLGRPGQAGPPR